jgi:hypothetical protein
MRRAAVVLTVLGVFALGAVPAQAKVYRFQGTVFGSLSGPQPSTIEVDATIRANPVTLRKNVLNVTAYDVEGLAVLCGGQITTAHFSRSASVPIPVDARKHFSDDLGNGTTIGGTFNNALNRVHGGVTYQDGQECGLGQTSFTAVLRP